MSSISHGIPYSPSLAPYSRSVVFLLGFLYSVKLIHQKNNIHAENELAIPAKLPTRRSKETVTNAAKLKVESGHLSQSSKHPLEWECCDTARWGWVGLGFREKRRRVFDNLWEIRRSSSTRQKAAWNDDR